MVVGHSMATIYSTTTDITTFHGKVVLFTGDCKGTRECVPIVLPPQSTFKWKKCSVIDDKEKLISWYTDNPSEYGNLWEPTIVDGTRVEVHIPRMIALPLRAASLYHHFKGAVLSNSIWQLQIPTLTMGTTGGWCKNGCSLQHRRTAEGGASQSPVSSGISHRHPLVQRRPHSLVDHRKARRDIGKVS